MTQEPKLRNGVSHATNSGKPCKATEPAFGNGVRDAIGLSLQAHFDDIANTPVPDKFLVLLAELEAKEARSES